MTEPRGPLRRARALAGRLRPRPAAAPEPPAAVAKRAPKPLKRFDGVGRLVARVEPAPAGPRDPAVLDRQVSDPFEAEAVRLGWLLVDAYERLSPTGAAHVLGHEDAAWLQYAQDALPPLRLTTSEVGEAYVSPPNHLRFRRMVDLARPGDRVFDVGHGAGHLAVHLVRDADVASYVGIDLETYLTAEAEELFRANGLTGDTVRIEQGDLYDLTADRVARDGADLVICCEVLEHVPDAERALEVLAAALPAGADLVFSVPLAGRLEGIWGHVSVFDVDRIQAMVDRAGLHVHHVEPLGNVWTLVVASNDPAPSARVRDAARRPPVRVTSPLVRARDFVDLAADAWSGEGVTPGEDCWATAVLPRRASLTADVEGLEALRLWFRVGSDALGFRLRIDAFAGDRRTATWTWKPHPDDDLGTLKRLALRPGWSTPRVVAGPHKDVAASDRIRLTPIVDGGEPVTIHVRASHLP